MRLNGLMTGTLALVASGALAVAGSTAASGAGASGAGSGAGAAASGAAASGAAAVAAPPYNCAPNGPAGNQTIYGTFGDASVIGWTGDTPAGAPGLRGSFFLGPRPAE